MKKILAFLTIVMATTGVYAQRVPSKIELKNNTTVTFVKEEVDSTRELLGIGIKVYTNGSKVSQDFLYSQMANIEFYEGVVIGNNVNRNTVEGGHLLEYPHFTEVGNQLIVKHSAPPTEDYPNLGLTYTLEWDCSKKSQRWTAYEFHNGVPDVISRSGSWKDDPDIPSDCQTHTSQFASPYSRGHMCPSMDRRTTTDQNQQTFYISNAHPQYNNHNEGLWVTLENKVHSWGVSSTFRDTLYVVKAGTIDNDDDILETTSTGLLVPKYFYMAVLCLKDGQYKAIGFWTEHTNEKITGANPADYAVSIDWLEERTGIDFFCNLPDETEEEVESGYTLTDWGLSNN